MSKFTFIKKDADLDGTETNHTVSMQFDEIYLDSVISNFQDFLKGCGFVFSGELQIVEEEKNKPAHSKHYYDLGRNL
jgi:hypothetical protein